MHHPDESHRDRDPAGGPDQGGEWNVLELFSLMLKRRRLIIYGVASVLAATALILIMTPNMYTSTVSILPSSSPDRMSELKSLAGLTGALGRDDNTSELFPVILRSHLIKDAILSEAYTFTANGEPQTLTLQEYFDEADADRLHAELDDIATFIVDKKLGVVHLSVKTEHPDLSRQLLTQYVAELEQFNLHKRRSRARDNERYLFTQLGQCRAELEAAEDSLAQFRIHNRDWRSATNPELLKMLARLEREVDVQSAVYLYLSREHESAQLEAQKDVPIVRLIGRPSLPTRKSSPARGVILLLAGFVSLFIFILIVLVYESLRLSTRRQSELMLGDLRKDLAKSRQRLKWIFRKADEPA